MSGKLIFIHGTTVRDVSGSMSRIRQRASILGIAADDVVAIEWGREMGPPARDITAALPPEYTRDAAGGPEVDETVAVWSLLLADPDAELRALALQSPAAAGGVLIGEESAATQTADGITSAAIPTEQLRDAGFDDADLARAREALAADPVLIEAANAVADPGSEALAAACARSLVARMLIATTPSGVVTDELPPAAYDARLRDLLVAELAALQLESAVGTRGVGDWLKGRAKDLLTPIATRVAVSRRDDFMGPLAHFLHDVAFYLNNGQRLRDHLTSGIRTHSDKGPPIVLAHSLGGIAAVDLLSDPAVKTGDDALEIEQLVTVGSQAPAVYLMDALHVLEAGPDGRPTTPPHTPWLNIYNREDLLSFCAERVFLGHDGIKDVAVDAGVPFPASHSAYFSVDSTFEAIRDFRP